MRLGRALSGEDGRAALALAAMLGLTALVYLPVLGADFLVLDDPEYVQQNPHVQQGLRWSTVAWAFTTAHAGNWHPVTWLSHALDWTLFGAHAGGHRAVNLLLHLLTTLLLFRALHALTAARWRSFAVAALFALHPMNVESVAWISERKNVLSGVFYAASLGAYATWVRGGGARAYAAVTVLFGLGLMAKPMLVTLPLVWLLLDVWPLARLRKEGARALVTEKLPWLAMSVAASAATLWAQSAGEAVVAIDEGPLGVRACVAVRGAAAYVSMLFWPEGLALYYPPHRGVCGEAVRGLGLLVPIAVSAAVLAGRGPFWTVGWAWFAGMLVPVSGIVQVGSQLMANRYVYHPMVGLAAAVVWLTADVLSRREGVRRLRRLLLLAVCAALAARTAREITYWRDSESLYARAIEVVGPDCDIDTVLGGLKLDRGAPEEAERHWRRALVHCPDLGLAHSRLGTLLARSGRIDEALSHLASAARAHPDKADVQYNLGLALWHKGRERDAADCFRRALALDARHRAAGEMLRRLESGPARH